MDMHVGSLVEHRSWGRGKILAVRQPNAQAYFPTLANDSGGPTRVVQLKALSLSSVQSDPVFDKIASKRPAAKSRAKAKTPAKR